MKTYIYQGYNQAGGTYMAYHVGRVMFEYFGVETFVVCEKPKEVMFSYPIDFPVVPQDAFEKMVTADDLFVCNPSFSDRNFGLRLPCKKLSYIQGVRTFRLLDVFFDHYVFVSDWVRCFIEKFYGISGNVIPAFIHTDLFSCSDDWSNRQASIPITQYKYDEVVFSRFLKLFSVKYPDCPIEFEKYPVMGQNEFAMLLRKHRYYLSLAVMEGFGLPMLEAMASGCATVGWNAGGSSEYTINGKNCLITRYGDIEALADQLYFMLSNPDEAAKLALEGYITSREFDVNRFDKAWVSELSLFLDLRPIYTGNCCR